MTWNPERAVARWSQYVQLRTETVESGGIRSTVAFSTEDVPLHRYFLARVWDDRLPPTVVIMTNPSTADAHRNDPTVARMVAFARDWLTGGLVVLNCFATRSTDPAGVVTAANPVGRYNCSIVAATLRECSREAIHLAAWGALAPRLAKQTGIPVVERIVRLYGETGLPPPWALRITTDGHPCHPLYMPRNSTLVRLPLVNKL